LGKAERWGLGEEEEDEDEDVVVVEDA